MKDDDLFTIEEFIRAVREAQEAAIRNENVRRRKHFQKWQEKNTA